MWRNAVLLCVVHVCVGGVPAAFAAPILFNDQATFQAQLTGDFTLVNLDAGALGAFATPYAVEDAGPAAAFAALGIDFFGVNAQVLGGQNFQTPTNRDRLIANGSGFRGEIAVNFIDPVNGVGAFSNNIDFGRIRAFSAPGLGGVFLGEVQFGPGRFGGLLTTDNILSAQFTCDFNQDRRCGVYDIQFGTVASPTAIPEPATVVLVGIGLAGALRRVARAPRL